MIVREQSEALALWRRVASVPEQVALINICDVAVRATGERQQAMGEAALIMAQALLSSRAPEDVAGALVDASMLAARLRRGHPGVRA